MSSSLPRNFLLGGVLFRHSAPNEVPIIPNSRHRPSPDIHPIALRRVPECKRLGLWRCVVDSFINFPFPFLGTCYQAVKIACPRLDSKRNSLSLRRQHMLTQLGCAGFIAAWKVFLWNGYSNIMSERGELTDQQIGEHVALKNFLEWTPFSERAAESLYEGVFAPGQRLFLDIGDEHSYPENLSNWVYMYLLLVVNLPLYTLSKQSVEFDGGVITSKDKSVSVSKCDAWIWLELAMSYGVGFLIPYFTLVLNETDKQDNPGQRFAISNHDGLFFMPLVVILFEVIMGIGRAVKKKREISIECVKSGFSTGVLRYSIKMPLLGPCFQSRCCIKKKQDSPDVEMLPPTV